MDWKGLSNPATSAYHGFFKMAPSRVRLFHELGEYWMEENYFKTLTLS